MLTEILNGPAQNDYFLCHFGGGNLTTDVTGKYTLTNALSGANAVVISNTVSRAAGGGHAAYFNGAGYLTVAPNAILPTSTSLNWTVECWHYQTATSTNPQAIFSTRSTNTGTPQQLGLYLKPYPAIYCFNGNLIQIDPGTATTNNTWHHIAMVKNGSTYTLYFDGAVYGTPKTSQTNITVPSAATTTVYIGNDGGAQSFLGYIDEYRISSFARYTAAFTPPATFS